MQVTAADTLRQPGGPRPRLCSGALLEGESRKALLDRLFTALSGLKFTA